MQLINHSFFPFSLINQLILFSFLKILSCVLACDRESCDNFQGRPQDPKSLDSKSTVTSETHKLPPELLKGNTTFFVYTKGKGGILKKEPIICSDNLQKNSNVKLIIHGFMSSCESFEEDIITEYAERFPNLNVICMDWSPHANPQDGIGGYGNVVLNLGQDAQILAKFLEFLSKFLKLKYVHIIGHSLGAHIAGGGGTLIKKSLGIKLGRITGLDPAGPFVDTIKSKKFKLDSKDAEFVDVTHTNAGKLGTTQDLAHADFYFNNGSSQPQCITETDLMADLYEEISGTCSHRTSRTYFRNSIQNEMLACKFDSYEKLKQDGLNCKDKIVYGEHGSTAARGKFFLKI